MKTQFITLAVPLQSSPAALRDSIEAYLRTQGEPLRWAVTGIKVQSQTAQVEAVVTVKSE